jgi:iron complex outermembrane receptor protein
MEGFARTCALLAGILLLAPPGLFAQQATGSLTGTIREHDGSPASGISVRITNQATGEMFDTPSNASGVFRIATLAPGSYRVRVERPQSGLDFQVEILQPGQAIDVGTLVLPQEGTASPQPSPATTGQAESQTAISPVYEQVTVTARRVEEEAQSVPIPMSVVSASSIEKTAAFNVNRLKELIPTVQFYSSNPRNSAINIRGLGSPFGLTNDGIEPGVGYYVDGVFYARPAAATLDFVDLERVEVLRGPQGTLFGKNTTAGAINITTRRPTFTPEANFELSYGNYGFIQAKGSISGPLTKKLAARLSFSGTQRDGVLYNVRTKDDVNDLNNVGVRAQFLFTPSDKLVLLVSGDYTRQRPEGYAQVVAGVAPTLRPANRQYPGIAADLGYRPPSFHAFDRLIDTDTPWRSDQDMGGASVEADWTIGKGQLTSITAWRYWLWRPSNDRDFIGLPVTTSSAAPSRQRQWTQEVRYAGELSSRANYLLGFFLFQQNLNPAPYHNQEQGSAAARFLLAPSAQAATPGLLDGYGQNINFDFRNISAAGFGQIEYYLTKRLRIAPGLRINYDQKKLDYDQQVYGGLQTDNPALIALQRSILSPLTYKADVGDTNVSGQATLSYKVSENVNAYATFATGFKSIGLNLGGVPTDAAGMPIVSAATVRPESVRHYEIGIKTQPLPGLTVNANAFNTPIRDFQTQVVNAQVGVLRGYLANARKVRVRGIELDANYRVNDSLTLYTSGAFTDGRYISFRDAPAPLEDTGGPQDKDISGSVLPGISKWAFSFGGEYAKPASFLGQRGEFFARVDASCRSWFSSNPSFSRYLIVDGYSLVNPRVGFRTREGWALSVWARNVMNTNYFELLSAAPGNSGLYVGLPGDPRTFGVTLSRTFGGKASGTNRSSGDNGDTGSSQNAAARRGTDPKRQGSAEKAVPPEPDPGADRQPASGGLLESDAAFRTLPGRPGLWVTGQTLPAGAMTGKSYF